MHSIENYLQIASSLKIAFWQREADFQKCFDGDFLWKKKLEQNKVSNIIAIFVIESGVFCQQHVNEDFENYTFIVLCYYLSLLKHSNFDIEKILRIKLLWDGKCNRFNKVEWFVLWLCIYRMEKHFIKNCLGKITTRTKAVNNSIAKYITV